MKLDGKLADKAKKPSFTVNINLLGLLPTAVYGSNFSKGNVSVK